MFLNFLNKREQKDFIELVKLSFEHSSPMNEQEERFMNALRVETELQKYEFKDVPYEELIMHFQSSTKKVKRAIFIELAGVADADEVVDDAEEDWLMTVGTDLEFRDLEMKRMLNWMTDFNDLLDEGYDMIER